LNLGLVDFHASAFHLEVEGDAIAHVSFFTAYKGYDSRAAVIIELVNLIFARCHADKAECHHAEQKSISHNL
jgi:hypothetical protein